MEKHDALHFCLIETVMGHMGIIASRIGLRGVILPKPSRMIVCQTVLQKYGLTCETALSFFGDLPQRFELYFKGNLVDFPDILDPGTASDFQKSVWEATRSIPYGETRSYSWVASGAGHYGAARAVGQALSKNPLPIVVPCHRVITGNGKLGGFSNGISIKKHLLKMENRVLVTAHGDLI